MNKARKQLFIGIVITIMLSYNLALSSCNSVTERSFDCDCGKLYVKFETKCKEESSNGDFNRLMDFIDEMSDRGCECQEMDGDDSDHRWLR